MYGSPPISRSHQDCFVLSLEEGREPLALVVAVLGIAPGSHQGPPSMKAAETGNSGGNGPRLLHFRSAIVHGAEAPPPQIATGWVLVVTREFWSWKAGRIRRRTKWGFDQRSTQGSMFQVCLLPCLRTPTKRFGNLESTARPKDKRSPGGMKVPHHRCQEGAVGHQSARRPPGEVLKGSRALRTFVQPGPRAPPSLFTESFFARGALPRWIAPGYEDRWASRAALLTLRRSEAGAGARALLWPSWARGLKLGLSKNPHSRTETWPLFCVTDPGSGFITERWPLC